MVELVSSPFNIPLFISYIIKYVYTNIPHSVGKGCKGHEYFAFLLSFYFEREKGRKKERLLWSLLQSHIFPINIKVVELMMCVNNGIFKLDKAILSFEYMGQSHST